MHHPTRFKSGALSVCVLGASLLAAAAHAAGPELMTNGGFESGDFTGFTATAGPSAGVFGVDNQGARNGAFSAFFGARNRSDTITQVLATTPGASYTVSFFLEGNLRRTDPSGFVGRFGSTTFIDLTDDDPAFGFKPFSFQVTATSASTALSFSAFNQEFLFRLDDVSVTAAVPEPSSYALMALGLGALGVAARCGKPA